jgi:O-antigen/teichoic acid export membrane protein
MIATRAATTARARLRSSRPRLEAIDRSEAALLSLGTLASGLLAYGFNVVAARALGPETFGAVGALWAGMFLISVLLFRPLEQAVSRAVADQVARGGDARQPVRSIAKIGVLVTLAACAACVAAWEPLTDGLFAGHAVLTAALVAGVAGYALSYFVRGLTSGVRWFGGYGLVLLADGGIRFVLAIPLLVWASPAIAGVAIAAAAGGGALAPLLSRKRTAFRRLEGEPGAELRVGAALRFAAPAAVIAGSEQVLLSGGPLLVLIAGGQGAALAAGVLFAATLLMRAPVFLFQGVAASLLPNLTTFRATGNEAALHRATVRTALALSGFAAVLVAGALACGPFAMELMYGEGFDASRLGLALLALGIGAFLAASTFCQAALARDQAGRAAIAWSIAAFVFVALELSLDGAAFDRVSIAFAVASLVAAAQLMAILWKGRAA